MIYEDSYELEREIARLRYLLRKTKNHKKWSYLYDHIAELEEQYEELLAKEEEWLG